MTTKLSDDPTAELDAIKRSLEEMAPRPGVDLAALTRQSLDTFFEARAKSYPEDDADLYRETAILARGLVTRLTGWTEFMTDMLAATAPTALLLLLMLGLMWLGWMDDRTTGHVRLTVVFALSLGGVAALVVGFLARRNYRIEGLFRRSGGAYVGGLIAITLASTWLLLGGSFRRVSPLVTAYKQLQQLTISAMQSWQSSRAFAPLEMEDAQGSLTTERLSANAASYRLSVTEAPGTLVADVRPTSGDVYLEREGHQNLMLVRIIEGEVKMLDSNGLSLVAADGSGEVRLNRSQTKSALPGPGRRVIAAYDPSTMELTAIAELPGIIKVP